MKSIEARERKEHLIEKLKEAVNCVKDVDSCVFIVCDDEFFSSMIKIGESGISTMIYAAIEDYPELYHPLQLAVSRYEAENITKK